ncbi:hypothetical protein L0337_19835 [candidate division KSB1 bacterium]|nr:hypothetical protein [candidate division KSB1 bacterium]
MKKSIILLAILPVVWLAGCAGLVPPIEEDPNTVTLIFKTGEKVEGRILDIQGDLIRFEPNSRVEENRSFGDFVRADEVGFVQLSHGSRFTVKEFIDYRWKPQSPAPLLGNGVTKTGQKEVTEATAEQDLQYEQLKKKAVAEMTPNEFGYFMLMKQQEIKAQPRPVGAFEQEKRVQPAQANTMAVKTDSGKVAPLTSSLTPRTDSKISKEGEVIKEIAGFLVEAELAGPFIKAAQQKKEQGDFLTLNQLWLVNEVTKTPAWKKRQDDLRNLSVEAEQAVAHVYLYAPDSLSQRLGLRFDPNVEMDFRDLMEQLHQRFGATVTMGDFRLLVAIFEEDGARAMREILNHYTEWRFAIENKHPLATKNLRD